MELCKKEDSTIFLLQIICRILSEQDKKELNKYNVLTRRNKRKSHTSRLHYRHHLQGKLHLGATLFHLHPNQIKTETCAESQGHFEKP